MDIRKLTQKLTKRKLLISIATTILLLLAILTMLFVNNTKNKELVKPIEEIDKLNIEEHILAVPEGYTAIYDAQGLQAINNNLAGKYILMSNIDLTDVDFQILAPTANQSFTGIFNGNGYTISNLKIESANTYVGLFGYVSGGTISNLILENENIKSTATSTTKIYVGGLVGSITSGNVSNIQIIGESGIEIPESVTASNIYVGGLVGEIDLKKNKNTGVNKVYVRNEINILNKTPIEVGGIAGRISAYSTSYATKNNSSDYGSSNASVNNVCAAGDINIEANNQAKIGGIAGYVYVYSYASIASDMHQTGSSISIASMLLGNAFTIGKIKIDSTNAIAGGLIGEIYIYSSSGAGYGSSNATLTLQSSYTMKELISNDKLNIEAIVGKTDKRIINSTGSYGRFNVNSVYWSPEITKINNSSVGEPMLVQQMLQPNSYAGWDFATIWAIDEGLSLPYLQGLPMPEEVLEQNYDYITYEGEGTEENPYIIETQEQLQAMEIGYKSHYKLGNDIVLSGNFEPIGLSSPHEFAGTLDGDGHSIRNLKIESNNQYVGLFSSVNGGTIKNLRIENANVKSNYASTSSTLSGGLGALVGYAKDATIENVEIKNVSNSLVTATNIGYVGGIVGFSSTSTISKSYATGQINATSTIGKINAGGIVGYANGYKTDSTVNNAYSTCEVNATSESGIVTVGGLVGEINNGKIVSTYAVGKSRGETTGTTNIGGLIGVAGSTTVENSYWSPKSTGQTTSTRSWGSRKKYSRINT